MKVTLVMIFLMEGASSIVWMGMLLKGYGREGICKKRIESLLLEFIKN